MTSNYETLYGVHLLDDLHNYFPALLYDSSSFGSMRDVLAYVQQQTRNRFDLFSYGQREYLSTHPAPQPPSDSYRRVVRTSFASMPAPQRVANSTLPSPAAPTLPSLNSLLTNLSTINQMEGRPATFANVPSIQVELTNNLDADDEEEEEEMIPQENAFITNALLSLLNIPTTQLTRQFNVINRGVAMDQFLQPVVVHPTAEQIAANTTLGNLVSDTDHSCAICQDALTSEQEGRKLNHCGHWFHKSCIDTWLERDVHCPVCRHDIREPIQPARTREDLEAELH